MLAALLYFALFDRRIESFIIFLFSGFPVFFLFFKFFLPLDEIAVRAAYVPGPLSFVYYLDEIKTVVIALLVRDNYLSAPG